MAKPIFLIQLNYKNPQHDVVKMRDVVERKLPDWHVLVALTAVEEPTFTVFSDKQADDVEIENLKQMLLNQFK